MSVCLAVSILHGGQTASAQSVNLERAKAGIHTYMFVLPAIDCYRTADSSMTLDDDGLDELLNRSIALAGDEHVEQLKQAAVAGAESYENFVVANGNEAYCHEIERRFGPAGSELPGLVRRRTE